MRLDKTLVKMFEADSLQFFVCLVMLTSSKVLSCPRMCTCDNYAIFHATNCDSQDLESFPSGIPEWSTELSFDGNYLTTLDLTAFDTTVYFEEFSIRYNEIERVKLSNLAERQPGMRGACNYAVVIFPRLKRVNLRGNALKKLPKCLLFAWPVLKILKLDENRIARIQDLNLAHPTARSASLKELSLRRNRITRIARDSLFTPSIALQNLTVLDVGENRIGSVESASFLFMRELVEVKLDRNRIRRVPPFAFVTTGRKTETIILARNRISWIDVNAFAGLPQLRRLDISENSIHCLVPRSLASCGQNLQAPEAMVEDQALIRSLERRYEHNLRLIRSVKVDGNDWTCDCSLKPLLHHNSTPSITPQMGDERCARPAPYQHRLLASVLRALDCPD